MAERDHRGLGGRRRRRLDGGRRRGRNLSRATNGNGASVEGVRPRSVCARGPFRLSTGPRRPSAAASASTQPLESDNGQSNSAVLGWTSRLSKRLS